MRTTRQLFDPGMFGALRQVLLQWSCIGGQVLIKGKLFAYAPDEQTGEDLAGLGYSDLLLDDPGADWPPLKTPCLRVRLSEWLDHLRYDHDLTSNQRDELLMAAGA